MGTVLFLAIVLAITDFSQGNSTSVQELSSFTGVRYGRFTYYTDMVTWKEAAVVCAIRGQHLVVIDSEEEELAIEGLLHRFGVPAGSPMQEAFIGFHDLITKDKYQTVLGKNLYDQYYSWAEGEPNLSGEDERCGGVYVNGKLNDEKCNMRLAFICEDYHRNA